MTQSKIDRVLKLVDELSPEEQERVAEQMKLHSLRREIQKGEAELDRGEGIPAEVVIAELRERNKAFRKKGTD